MTDFKAFAHDMLINPSAWHGKVTRTRITKKGGVYINYTLHRKEPMKEGHVTVFPVIKVSFPDAS